MGFMIGMGRWTWAFCGLHDADRMCTRCIHPIVSCTLGMVYYSLWHYGSKHLLRRYLTTQIIPQTLPKKVLGPMRIVCLFFWLWQYSDTLGMGFWDGIFKFYSTFLYHRWKHGGEYRIFPSRVCQETGDDPIELQSWKTQKLLISNMGFLLYMDMIYISIWIAINF